MSTGNQERMRRGRKGEVESGSLESVEIAKAYLRMTRRTGSILAAISDCGWILMVLRWCAKKEEGMCGSTSSIRTRKDGNLGHRSV